MSARNTVRSHYGESGKLEAARRRLKAAVKAGDKQAARKAQAEIDSYKRELEYIG